MTWERVWMVSPAGLPVYRFDQQRAKCEACRHCEQTGTMLACCAEGKQHQACSAVRADEQRCGDGARWWKGRE